MHRAWFVVLLLVATCGSAFLFGCGNDDEEVADLRPILDTLPVFPGAAVDGDNDGAEGPALLVKGDIEDFKNSQRMFVASSVVTQQQVLDYFAEEVLKLGWEVEDPPDPNTPVMAEYCAPPAPITVEGTVVELGHLVTCQSYVKDDVRLIVSAPIQLQLNPIATQGASYHLFLEKA